MSHYCGRFAPSPSGQLHFGSLVSAMSSYLEAIQHQGKWLLRIDDIDQTRTIPGMDEQIIDCLEKLGFTWQGNIQYQSQHITQYQAALQQLQDKNLIYACQCSRKNWQAKAKIGIEGRIYPDICRHLVLIDQPGYALRIRTPDKTIGTNDLLYGEVRQNLHQAIGDFVLRRADGYFAYQLAVVVDDYLAGITHVVRGADLLTSTPRQIYLQRQLGYSTPEYLHTPLVIGEDGKKLSKSDAAHPVDIQNPVPTLTAAWHFLRQPKMPDIDNTNDFWRFASQNWDISRLKP